MNDQSWSKEGLVFADILYTGSVKRAMNNVLPVIHVFVFNSPEIMQESNTPVIKLDTCT